MVDSFAVFKCTHPPQIPPKGAWHRNHTQRNEHTIPDEKWKIRGVDGSLLGLCGLTSGSQRDTFVTPASFSAALRRRRLKEECINADRCSVSPLTFDQS